MLKEGGVNFKKAVSKRGIVFVVRKYVEKGMSI